MNGTRRPAAASLVLGVVVGCLLGVPGALADRGAIVALKDVDIEEPAQRAIVAYNGVREILILQTDVRASRETKIVEFMPLPTKPEVSLAPEGCFAALADIIKKHNVRYFSRYGRTKAEGRGEGEAVKVVVTAQLGPHGVTVVEVKDADAFVLWVREFFRKNGLGEPILNDELRKIVASYLTRKICFFAFDLVTVSPETKTVQPLTYQFKTDHLYYPLEVTNLYGGTGVVELFTILPAGSAFSGPVEPYLWIRAAISQFPGAGAKAQWTTMKSAPATLKAAELGRLHPSLPGLMWGEKGHLRALRYEGPLRFNRDVYRLVGYYDASKACEAFLRGLGTGNAELIEAHVAVPFAFDRKTVITDKAELMGQLREVAEKTRGKPLAFTDKKGVVQFPIERYGSVLKSEFNRKFVREHLLKAYHPVMVRVTIQGEEMLLFLRREPELAVYRVVGFSD